MMKGSSLTPTWLYRSTFISIRSPALIRILREVSQPTTGFAQILGTHGHSFGRTLAMAHIVHHKLFQTLYIEPRGRMISMIFRLVFMLEVCWFTKILTKPSATLKVERKKAILNHFALLLCVTVKKIRPYMSNFWLAFKYQNIFSFPFLVLTWLLSL